MSWVHKIKSFVYIVFIKKEPNDLETAKVTCDSLLRLKFNFCMTISRQKLSGQYDLKFSYDYIIKNKTKLAIGHFQKNQKVLGLNFVFVILDCLKKKLFG